MAASPVNAQNGPEAQELLRLLLNAPRVAQYFHFDSQPDRLPLRVINRTSVELGRPAFKVGGANVEIVSGSERGRPFFEITQVQMDAERARIAFRYRVEGIRGDAAYQRTGGTWKLQDVKVVEQ